MDDHASCSVTLNDRQLRLLETMSVADLKGCCRNFLEGSCSKDRCQFKHIVPRSLRTAAERPPVAFQGRLRIAGEVQPATVLSATVPAKTESTQVPQQIMPLFADEIGHPVSLDFLSGTSSVLSQAVHVSLQPLSRAKHNTIRDSARVAGPDGTQLASSLSTVRSVAVLGTDCAVARSITPVVTAAAHDIGSARMLSSNSALREVTFERGTWQLSVAPCGVLGIDHCTKLFCSLNAVASPADEHGSSQRAVARAALATCDVVCWVVKRRELLLLIRHIQGEHVGGTPSTLMSLRSALRDLDDDVHHIRDPCQPLQIVLCVAGDSVVNDAHASMVESFLKARRTGNLRRLVVTIDFCNVCDEEELSSVASAAVVRALKCGRKALQLRQWINDFDDVFSHASW